MAIETMADGFAVVYHKTIFRKYLPKVKFIFSVETCAINLKFITGKSYLKIFQTIDREVLREKKIVRL